MSHATPPSTLEAALAPVLPPDAVWQRDPSGRLAQVPVTGESPGPHRVLAVEVRPDGDYQVDFWNADNLRGPAEALFVVTPENEAEVADAIADLVRGLLEERFVLELGTVRIGLGEATLLIVVGILIIAIGFGRFA